ncbi:hypothetical protein F5I97DRAFT_160584 [Phlebopus sp. FC_14]|nr:hypothetical protein F5I97DRAFT_160584 [Phlebopus sp. FC_14]
MRWAVLSALIPPGIASTSCTFVDLCISDRRTLKVHPFHETQNHALPHGQTGMKTTSSGVYEELVNGVFIRMKKLRGDSAQLARNTIYGYYTYMWICTWRNYVLCSYPCNTKWTTNARLMREI